MNKLVGNIRPPRSAQGNVTLLLYSLHAAAKSLMSLRSDVPASKFLRNAPDCAPAPLSLITDWVAPLSNLAAVHTLMFNSTSTALDDMLMMFSLCLRLVLHIPNKC